MNHKLVRQANDLFVRICEAKDETYRQAQTMPYVQYKARRQRLEKVATRAFDRLLRRTRPAAAPKK